MNKKFKSKMRKAADGGNLALIVLAVGVIIIIGMYLFTKTFGGKLNEAGGNIGTGLTNTTDFNPTAGNP